MRLSNWSRAPWAMAAALGVSAGGACARHPKAEHALDWGDDSATSAFAASATSQPRPFLGAPDGAVSDGRAHARAIAPPPRLINRVAYIPPQCFTKTRASGETEAKNPCYACHTRSEPPNYTNDDDLQLRLTLPSAAKHNPWTNLFDPPVFRAPRRSDDDVLAYVRSSNYLDDAGNIVLAHTLEKVPAAWDANGNGHWDGFVPDMWFRFDDRGFDHRPDGSLSGWRAFAYYPFLGTFFPANGSADDVAIRLPAAFRETSGGQFDRAIYEVNLAVVEALVRRTSVDIDPVDETALGVDLDQNGRLGQTTRVAFDAAPDPSGRTRMHYVGRAHDEEAAWLHPIAPGLYPLGTEFFHTVRYLDVGADGVVKMAPRMKEVRYQKKVHWASYDVARANTRREAQEQNESPDGTHAVSWANERGIATRTWLLQGFIESADGSLRPQTFEETAFCEGCHAGIGATTDSTFAFARKMDDPARARGWFHWSQHDLRGIREPKRRDGEYEYAYYLLQAGGGDELRENEEVVQRFFDDGGAIRPAEIRRLHDDIAYLLLPSAARALALDRAYMATVSAQAFAEGRDAILSPARNVYAEPPIGQRTGVRKALTSEGIAPEGPGRR